MVRELGLRAVKVPAGVYTAVSGRAGIGTITDLALGPVRADKCSDQVWLLADS